MREENSVVANTSEEEVLQWLREAKEDAIAVRDFKSAKLADDMIKSVASPNKYVMTSEMFRKEYARFLDR